MKKKIVIIGPAHPLRGGIATFNERMARAFNEAGHEAIIYTFSLQYPNFLFPGKTQFSPDPKPADLDIRVKINSMNPLNWRKVGREIKKLEADIVLPRFWIPYMGPCLGTISRIIRKNKKSRIIPIADNVIPHEKRPGDKMFTKYFINSCDGFITMAKSVQEDLNQFDTKKPRTITPHPIFDTFGDKVERSEAKRDLKLDPDTHYLLFFGFIRAYKGLDLLLEAMADEHIRNLPIKLIIAGEYYQKPEVYQEQIEKLGIQSQLVLRNEFIPGNEVGKYFCASELVVQPYKTATQSGVTQIAYHFDIPMVVTNVSGLPENVPDGKVGYVVERNPKEIADAIVKYFEEKKEAEFSANIVEWKKRYEWDVLVNNILNFAEKV